MKAARTASSDFSGDDAHKDFMVLPDTHVLSLRTAPTATGSWRVTGIDTSQGFIELAPGGVAVGSHWHPSTAPASRRCPGWVKTSWPTCALT